MRTQDTATTTIIGAGFTGISVAIEQARTYHRLQQQNPVRLPPLTIRIIDKSGDFGTGLPYSHDSDIFLLNQPAYAMSPFADDPDHFTRWLQTQDSNATQDDFASRKQYGQYLRDIFNQAVTDHPDIRFECITAEVTSIDHNTVRFSVSTADKTKYNTDTLIIADGHQPSGFLQEYARHPRFFDTPYDVDKARTLLTGDTQGVLIIGTGQSAIDSLAVLDHIGYQGPIHAVSRNLVTPWKFEPALYRQDIAPYEFKILTAETIYAQNAQTETALKSLLSAEIRSAEHSGYGIAHILTAYNETALQSAFTADNIDALRSLSAHIKALYSNPTPPRRFALLQELQSSGQLHYSRTGISAAQITDAADGFHVNDDTGAPIAPKISVIFNGASCARCICDHTGEILSPLLRDAFAKGLAAPADCAKAALAGEQITSGLYINGPATNSERWGVETFRKDNQTTARSAVLRTLQNFLTNVQPT